jgi:hypothetical protein
VKNIRNSIRDNSQRTTPLHSNVAKIAKVMTKAGQSGRFGCALSAATGGFTRLLARSVITHPLTAAIALEESITAEGEAAKRPSAGPGMPATPAGKCLGISRSRSGRPHDTSAPAPTEPWILCRGPWVSSSSNSGASCLSSFALRGDSVSIARLVATNSRSVPISYFLILLR